MDDLTEWHALFGFTPIQESSTEFTFNDQLANLETEARLDVLEKRVGEVAR